MKRFWRDLSGHYKYAIYSAKASLKSEVSNSYLNWIWWVLEPFCFMLIYAYIFGVVFNAREPYMPLFIFVGLTLWNFFDHCLTQSVKLMHTNKSIVSKVYIPKFILLVSRMFFNGYKMLFSMVVVVGMLIYFHVPLTWNVIFVIPLLMLLILFTFACMTHLMHYGVYVQDLTNVVNIVLRMMFYLTGIMFNIESRLPPRAAGIVEKCNPMALIIVNVRKCVLYSQRPELFWVFVWMGLSVIIAAFGIRKIYKNENSYIKVI